MLEFPTYIVAEVPDPMRGWIQQFRSALGTPVAVLPVEITLAGSSGVGPIPAGTDQSLMEMELDRVLSGFTAIPLRFSAIRSFPGTSTYYLEPAVRLPFDKLHQALCASEIPFDKSPWPYNPHCTLRMGDPFSAEDAMRLLRTPIPQSEGRIVTISVYGFDRSAKELSLIVQRTLRED